MIIPSNMISQNDPKLPQVFREEGCSSRTLMAMAEVCLDRALTPLQVQLCIATAEKDATVQVSENAETGKNEHKITLYAFKLLSGLGWYYRQVGAWKAGHFEAWDGSQIDPSTIGFSKLHWETDYPAGHWTLGDAHIMELWDPWSTEPGFNPWDETGKKGWTINKKRIDAAYCYRLYKG